MSIQNVVLWVAIFGAMGGAAIAQAPSAADAARQAESAPLDRQAELFMRAAELELRACNKLYDAGQVDEARNTLNDMVVNSDKAAEAATKSHKRIKNTEIDLRKMSDKLRDLKRTLNFEDQPAVQAAMDHLEELRTSLLASMFGKPKK